MKIIIGLLLLTLQNVYSQQSIEGKWYLVSKNNLKLTEITQDSIFTHRLAGFSVEKNTHFESDERMKILDKEIIGDTIKYKVNNERKGLMQMSVYLEKSSKPYRLFLYSGSKNDKISRPPFRLVSEEEINSYDANKSLLDMSEEDFLKFARRIEQLIEESKKNRSLRNYWKNYFYSEMKYSIADLGYDPRVKLFTLDVMLEKFSHLPRTKEYYNKMFNKK